MALDDKLTYVGYPVPIVKPEEARAVRLSECCTAHPVTVAIHLNRNYASKKYNLPNLRNCNKDATEYNISNIRTINTEDIFQASECYDIFQRK